MGLPSWADRGSLKPREGPEGSAASQERKRGQDVVIWVLRHLGKRWAWVPGTVWPGEKGQGYGQSVSWRACVCVAQASACVTVGFRAGPVGLTVGNSLSDSGRMCTSGLLALAQAGLLLGGSGLFSGKVPVAWGPPGSLPGPCAGLMLFLT